MRVGLQQKTRTYRDSYSGKIETQVIYTNSPESNYWFYQYNGCKKEIFYHQDMKYWSDESIWSVEQSVVLVRDVPLNAVKFRCKTDPNSLDYCYKRETWINGQGNPINWLSSKKRWSDEPEGKTYDLTTTYSRDYSSFGPPGSNYIT